MGLLKDIGEGAVDLNVERPIASRGSADILVVQGVDSQVCGLDSTRGSEAKTGLIGGMSNLPEFLGRVRRSQHDRRRGDGAGAECANIRDPVLSGLFHIRDLVPRTILTDGKGEATGFAHNLDVGGKDLDPTGRGDAEGSDPDAGEGIPSHGIVGAGTEEGNVAVGNGDIGTGTEGTDGSSGERDRIGPVKGPNSLARKDSAVARTTMHAHANGIDKGLAEAAAVTTAHFREATAPGASAGHAF